MFINIEKQNTRSVIKNFVNLTYSFQNISFFLKKSFGCSARHVGSSFQTGDQTLPLHWELGV